MKHSIKFTYAVLAATVGLLSFSSPSFALPNTGDVFCNINNSNPNLPIIRVRTFVNNFEITPVQNQIVYDDGFGLDKSINIEKQRCQRRARDLCASSFINTNGGFTPAFATPGSSPAIFRLSTVTVSGNLFTPSIVFNCETTTGGQPILAPKNKLTTNAINTNTSNYSISQPLNVIQGLE